MVIPVVELPSFVVFRFLESVAIDQLLSSLLKDSLEESLKLLTVTLRHLREENSQSANDQYLAPEVARESKDSNLYPDDVPFYLYDYFELSGPLSPQERPTCLLPPYPLGAS